MKKFTVYIWTLQEEWTDVRASDEEAAIESVRNGSLFKAIEKAMPVDEPLFVTAVEQEDK